jgi:hypothetical protein
LNTVFFVCLFVVVNCFFLLVQLGGHPEPGSAHCAARGPRVGLHVWFVRRDVIQFCGCLTRFAGKGVYFADMVSKSANYCCTSRSSNTGVLLLCDVALGDQYERFDAEVSKGSFLKTHLKKNLFADLL